MPRARLSPCLAIMAQLPTPPAKGSLPQKRNVQDPNFRNRSSGTMGTASGKVPDNRARRSCCPHTLNPLALPPHKWGQFQTQSPPPLEHGSAGSVKTTSFVVRLTTSREGALGIRGALEQRWDGPGQAMGGPGPATPAVITPSTRTPVTHNFDPSLTPSTHTGHT